MAKKKGGGGSNLGLIITLVFFVLSTVILGVTTYMGYSDMDTKDKAKDKAIAEQKVAEEARNWYRFQSRVLRTWMGFPPAGDKDAPTELAKEKAQFDAGSLAYAGKQTDKDDFSKLAKTLHERQPWDASKNTAPAKTYEQRLDDLRTEIENLKAEVKRAQAATAKIKGEKDEAEGTAAKEIAALKLALDNVKTTFARERAGDLADIASKAGVLRKEGEQTANLRRQLDAATKELDKQTALAKKLGGDLARVSKESRDLREQLDTSRTQVAALQEKAGIDPRVIETAMLDSRAMQILKEWNRDWRVIDIDRRGDKPYINLGSSDGLAPQVTFSLHSMGLDGKLSPIAKGTVEVVRIIGPHLASVRVTSVKDAKKDPILKGDRLFNPTWDPSRKKRVALAGIADLGGDGTDNTEDMRKLLTRQNVDIDAYVDVKDEKTPKMVGKGISINTDYLILGESLEGVNHPKARDKDYVTRFDKLVRDMKDKATANGVTVISLRKYLDMIGYRAPKIVTNTAGYGR